MQINRGLRSRKFSVVRIILLLVLSLCGLALESFRPVCSAELPTRQTLARAARYEALLRRAAAQHATDARLLWVVAYLESRFRPQAISRKGAHGLMQLMPATAARFGVRNPHNPAEAIEAAARYLRLLAEKFGYRPALLLAAYNAGETAVEAYLTGRMLRAGQRRINPRQRMTGGIPPYQETQRYVRDGLALLQQFERAELRLNESGEMKSEVRRELKSELKEADSRRPRLPLRSISYVQADSTTRTEASEAGIARPQRSITFGDTAASSR